MIDIRRFLHGGRGYGGMLSAKVNDHLAGKCRGVVTEHEEVNTR